MSCFLNQELIWMLKDSLINQQSLFILKLLHLFDSVDALLG